MDSSTAPWIFSVLRMVVGPGLHVKDLGLKLRMLADLPNLHGVDSIRFFTLHPLRPGGAQMKTGLLLFMFIFLGSFSSPLWAEPGNVPSGPAGAREALNAFRGETLSYDIAFLWFERLAVAEFSLTKSDEPNRYRAVLEARTLGIASWLTGNRRQRYVSYLRLADDGSLRPESYDADMYRTKGGMVTSRLKNWVYDYPRRQIIEKVTRNGRESPVKRYSMGEGAYPYDILGAFYNFRAGLFGPVQGGASYQIPSFARGGSTDIAIAVLPENRRPKDTPLPAGGLVVKVVLDPEVFDTGDGTLYIWFDGDMRPGKVIVKDVVGLGDVRATLRSHEEVK
jgi:hypothetical protein